MIYIIYCLEMGKGRRGRPKKNVTLENEPKGRKISNTFVDKNDLFFSSDEDERKEN